MDVDSAVIVLQNGARYKHVASRDADLTVIERTIRLSQNHTEYIDSDSAGRVIKKRLLTTEIAQNGDGKQTLLAAPLMTSCGRFIGFLSIGCKIDRTLTEPEKSYLRLLADHVPTLLWNYVHDFNQKLSWESKSKFSVLLETIADTVNTPIWARDEHGAFLYANRSYKQLVGVGHENLIGTAIHQVLDKEIADKARSRDKKVFSSGRMIVLNDDYTIDGNLRHLQ